MVSKRTKRKIRYNVLKAKETVGKVVNRKNAERVAAGYSFFSSLSTPASREITGSKSRRKKKDDFGFW